MRALSTLRSYTEPKPPARPPQQTPAAAPLSASAFRGGALCAARASAPAPAVSMAMSKSVPFLEKPARLDGMPGNVEFDPLLISNYVSPKFLREAELKHGRYVSISLFPRVEVLRLPRPPRVSLVW